MQYDEFTVFRRKSQKLIDIYRVSNSSHTWDYVTLSPQIKNLWAISPTGF